MNAINASDLDEKTSQIKSINLVLQFLFFELRYSNKVRRWFIRKLSMELDELLTKTTIGKFFSKLSVSFYYFVNIFFSLFPYRVYFVLFLD